MDPILKVVLFLLKKKNIDAKVDSVKSFFESGILFPKFVSLAFKIDEIPNVNPNPKQKSEKDKNNEIAFQFILTNNASIAKMKPSFNTATDQLILLKEILTKQCFHINEEAILNKCNTIVKGSGVQFSTKSDLIKWKSLVAIFESLSGTKSQPKDTSIIDSYDFTRNLFESSKSPLILDSSSLEDSNSFLFFIQIEILFDIYSEKVHELTKEMKQIQSQRLSGLTPKFSLDNSPSKVKFPKSDNKPSDDSSSSDDDFDTDTDTSLDYISEEQRQRNLLPSNYKEGTDSEFESETIVEEQGSLSTNQSLNDVKIDSEEVVDYSEASDDLELELEMDLDSEFLQQVGINPEQLNQQQNQNQNQQQQQQQKLKLKHSKKKKDKKVIINEFILFQEMREKALLNTINALSNTPKKFENIHQTIEDDFIPKFVKEFLHDDYNKIENIYLSPSKIYHGLKELTSVEEKNIFAVIDYLKKKESKFQVLTFNFRNKYLADSSAILFYNTFLNFFFLKQTRKEIFRRCTNILFPTAKEKSINEFKILTSWNTFVKLVYFVVEGKKMIKLTNVKANKLFEKGGIPQIFDKKFLENCTSQKELPFEIYYQLQFIFNALDTKFKKTKIVEYFLIALKKLNEIHIPGIEFITASVRAKNISLILQTRRHKQFLIDKENKKKKSDEQEKQDKNSNTDINDNKIDNAQRFYLNRLSLQKKNSKYAVQNEDQFWNQPDLNYLFDDGVLFNKNLTNEQSENEWTKEITHILGKKQQKETINDDHSSGIQLYKLFIYDENEKKWKINLNDLNLFEQRNKLSSTTKTPMIFYLDSNEEEIISINSKLSNNLYHKKDVQGDEFFVYALCESKTDIKTKPIFLHLLVPKNKEKQENIQRIVVSIYTILSFMCDISIVLLDSQFYKSQIELAELISKINKSCYKRLNKLQSNVKKDTSEFSPSNKNAVSKGGIIDEIIDSDDDEDFDESDSDTEYEFNTDDNSNKEMKIIFLVKDSSNKFNPKNDQKLNESKFFTNVLKNINKERRTIHFIKTNDKSTYESFMKEMNEIFAKNGRTFNEIKVNFKIFVNNFNLSDTYISLKRNENWKNKLNELIDDRYFLISNDVEMNTASLSSVYQKLEQEMKNNLLFDFDDEFAKLCKISIFNIKKENYQKNRKTFTAELEKSAKMNIDLLDNYKDLDFKMNEKVENMINSHIYFIKDEYLNMIKSFADPKDFNIVYEDNIDILNQRISSDIQSINKIAESKQEEYDKSIKTTDFEEELNQGTDYHIRESVNVRDMKVIIELGKDLKDEIEQDF